MEAAEQRDKRIYDLNLTAAIEEAQYQIDQITLTISLGEMWMQKKSDVSFNVSAALGKLVCSHKRATVALSQLRYWTAGNGYATSLLVSKLLTNWSGGSVLLMELIEAGLLMQWWEADFIEQVPELPSEIEEMYQL